MAISTTLKLPEELTQRIAAAAENAGVTSHAFMVEVIEAGIRCAELGAGFVAGALKAEQEVAACGEVYAMDAVHKHFRDRLAGKPMKALKPVSIKSRR